MDMTFQQTVEAYFEAIKERNLSKLLSTIAIDEDIELILYNGARFKGRSAAINLHSAWLADPDWRLETQILRIVETPEMACAFVLADYSDEKLGTTSFNGQHYVNLVFVKKDGRWHLVHDQATVAMTGR